MTVTSFRHSEGFPIWAKQNFPHSQIQKGLIEQLSCRLGQGAEFTVMNRDCGQLKGG